jgi:hypothetical protein
MPLPMTEPDWEKAPTVYRVIVDRTPLPVHDARPAGTGLAAALRRRFRRTLGMGRAMDALETMFGRIQGEEPALSASVTRVSVELSDDAVMIHLLLWNGTRVTATCYDYDGRRTYAIGHLSPGGWLWTSELVRFEFVSETRGDSRTLPALHRASPSRPEDAQLLPTG